MKSAFRIFGAVAIMEGISYLVLLGLAMPLKYFFDMPLAVKLVGWAHGVLFILYMALLLICWQRYRLSFSRVIWYFVASLLPFLPFLIGKKLIKQNAETV